MESLEYRRLRGDELRGDLRAARGGSGFGTGGEEGRRRN